MAIQVITIIGRIQVSMLSDQIHNQTDKILDLERTLDSKKEALKKTEDLLQIEMINRWRRNTCTNRMVDRFSTSLAFGDLKSKWVGTLTSRNPRSSLETTKLELLSEVSGLKLRQVLRACLIHH